MNVDFGTGRKILFLDVDGVLNNSDVFKISGKEFPEGHIGENEVKQLNRIVDCTACEIVLSSAWRQMMQLSEFIDTIVSKGFIYPNSFIGVTPHDRLNYIRGNEIQMWLDKNNVSLETDKIVILDDDADMAHLIPYLVQTTYKSVPGNSGGLTNEIADEVIRRLL